MDASRVTWIAQESDTKDIDKLAVAVGPGTLDPWGHVGILHRTGSKLEFLHLAWHHRLTRESPPVGFVWVKPGLHPMLAAQVAARCRRICRKYPHGNIPYAPRFFETTFSEEGDLLLGEEENGLTCATFVLAVFASVSLPLVRTGTWPQRDSDEAFRDFVIQGLRNELKRCQRKAELYAAMSDPDSQSKATGYTHRALELEHHIEAVLAEPRCARFLPIEVAASSYVEEIPIPFEEARRLANLLEAALQSKSGPGSDDMGPPT